MMKISEKAERVYDYGDSFDITSVEPKKEKD